MVCKPVEVRLLEKRHISSIIKIQNETKLSVWQESAYAEEILRNDSICFVAEASELVVGFIVARHTNKGTNDEKRSIEIYNIGVFKDFQKQGIGSLLIRTILGADDDRPAEIWLEVRKSNSSAIKFYQMHSFKSTGIRKNFFSDPVEDAILMKCET
jgi:[ribosomal protein S18]-alanine N-acetyltransferase